MAGFLLRRAFAAMGLVLVVSAGALLLGRLAPGDAASGLTMAHASEETMAEARTRAGLDASVPALFVRWARGLVHLDLGTSSSLGLPVRDLVVDAAAHTVLLGLLVLLLATAVGVPLGVMTGARPGGALAWIVAPISVALIACPPVIGVLGLLLLAVSTGWLPVTQNIVVPLLALALPLAASIERLQSQSMRDAMTPGERAAAAARGLSSARVTWVHAARRALGPLLGVYGVIIGSVLSGSLAVETLSSWPGLGALMLRAVVSRDVFLVAGCAFAAAVFLAVGQLVADVLRAWSDPRVRG
jgi:peptide/nickel transport system permease protein